MIGYNRNDAFVDTRLLRDHVSKLKNQSEIAKELYDCVRVMTRLCEPEEEYKYNAILRDIKKMVEFLKRMATALDDIEYGAVRVSQKIGMIIEEDSNYVRDTVDDNLML